MNSIEKLLIQNAAEIKKQYNHLQKLKELKLKDMDKAKGSEFLKMQDELKEINNLLDKIDFEIEK